MFTEADLSRVEALLVLGALFHELEAVDFGFIEGSDPSQLRRFVEESRWDAIFGINDKEDDDATLEWFVRGVVNLLYPVSVAIRKNDDFSLVRTKVAKRYKPLSEQLIKRRRSLLAAVDKGCRFGSCELTLELDPFTHDSRINQWVVDACHDDVLVGHSFVMPDSFIGTPWLDNVIHNLYNNLQL